MELLEEIRILAEKRGADFFGIADLGDACSAIAAQGGPGLSPFTRAVAIGIILAGAVVDRIAEPDDRAAAATYRHAAYDVVNTRLDLIASEISSLIQKTGYPVIPVPAAQRVDDRGICGLFSHKLAARLAGLGWIGRSCLLVTPAAGPRVRWVTVLTDAPLPASGKPMEDRCGTCTACIDICPAGAFTGKQFREEESREARFDARACERFIAGREERSGYPVCGLCLFVCPHGRK